MSIQNITYEMIRNKIILQMIPLKGNEERLSLMPHRLVEDMAAVYRVMPFPASFGISASFLVTTSLIESMEITENSLFCDALLNMRLHYPCQISSLSEMIEETAGGPDDIYVATNNRCAFGSGVILSKEFKSKASGLFGGGFFILPSSIHEMILVNKEHDPCSLAEIVKHVNDSYVSENEKLTDNVYYYDPETDKIRTAAAVHERKPERSLVH